MKYSIIKRADPTNRKIQCYYASPCYDGILTLDQLAEDLSDATTLNKVDITAALTGLITRIPKYALMGYRLKIGDLGTFRISFKSRGHLKKEDVTSDDIINPRIVFLSGTALKSAVTSKISYTYSGKIQESTEETPTS